MRDSFEHSKTIYYLESILRNLDEVSSKVEGLSLASEVLADNRDWLDCYIDKLKKDAPATRDMEARK